MIHHNITDQYRVGTNRDNGAMADYVLKVYDDKIRLFTSNGILPTDFSCDLKEIYRIKYLPARHHKSMNGHLSITIKNAKSKYVILTRCLHVKR